MVDGIQSKTSKADNSAGSADSSPRSRSSASGQPPSSATPSPHHRSMRKIIHTYPLIKECDMSDEMKTETMELCVTACEKHSENNESAARMIKETMDRRYGAAWHVVVGQGFGLEVTHEVMNLFYMFLTGSQAICVWKCS